MRRYDKFKDFRINLERDKATKGSSTAFWGCVWTEWYGGVSHSKDCPQTMAQSFWGNRTSFQKVSEGPPKGEEQIIEGASMSGWCVLSLSSKWGISGSWTPKGGSRWDLVIRLPCQWLADDGCSFAGNVKYIGSRWLKYMFIWTLVSLCKERKTDR